MPQDKKPHPAEDTWTERALYKSVFDNASIGVAFVGKDGRPTHTNSTFQNIIGYSNEELSQMSFPEFTHKDDIEKDLHLFEKLKAGEITHYCIEKRYITKSQGTTWVELNVSIAFEDKILAFVVDISDRVKLRNDVEDREGKFQQLYESIDQGIVDQDAKGHIISANKAAQDILGLSLDQLKGVTSTDPRWRAIHEDGSDYPGDTHPPMIVLKTGKPVKNKIMGIYHPIEDRYVWIKISGYPVFSGTDKKPIKVYSVFTDITSEYEMQNELKKNIDNLFASNHNLVETQNLAQIGNWEYDMASGKSTLSPLVHKIYGVPVGEDILPEEGISFFHEESRDIITEAYTKLLQDGVAYDLELKVKSRQGKETWVRTIGYPIYEKDKIIGARGLFQDIDLKKRNELALREKSNNLESHQRKINLAQVAAGVGIWDWNIIDNELIWDEQMHALYGTSRNDFSNDFEAWQNGLHPDDKAKGRVEIQNALDNKKKFDTLFRVIRPNGEIRQIRAIAEVIRDAEGNPCEMIGVNWDVTEEVLRNEKLIKNEERLRQAQSIANIGNFEFDIVKNDLKWSDQMYEIFEQSRDAFNNNYEAFMSIIHPDDRQKVDNDVNAAIVEKREHDVEHRIILSSGKEKVVRERGRIYYDDNDKPIRILGTTQDITSERNLQDKLQENLEYLKVLSDLALKMNDKESFEDKINDAIAVLGKSTGVSRVYVFENFNKSQNCKNTFEWCQKRVKSNKASLQNLSYEEDLPLFKERLLRDRKIIVSDCSAKQSNMRSPLISNQVKSFIVFPIYIGDTFHGFIGFSQLRKKREWTESEQNLVETVSGIVANAYKEKRAVMALKASERKYRSLAEMISDPYAVYDKNLKYTFWNEASATETGIIADDVIGKNYREVVGIHHNDEFEEKLKLALRTGKQYKMVSSYNNKHFNLLIYGGNKQVSVIAHDVTAEKNAERKINELNASLEFKVEERTAELKKLSNQLIEQKRLLQAVFDNTSLCIFIKDLDGRFLMLNKAFNRMNGINEKPMLGGTAYDFFSNEVADRFSAMDRKVVQEQRAITFEEEEEIKANNKSITLLTTKFPLYDVDGNPYAVCGISSDITETKRHQERLVGQAEELRISNDILQYQQEKLKKSENKLKTANEELESFSYSVSHDLRAPLRALEGFSKLLVSEYSEQLDERAKTWFNFIIDNTLKMDTLINDILAFSRIARSEINVQPLDMHQLVKGIIEEESKQYEGTDINIKMSKLHSALGDQKVIRQVWVNLISNAFKYSSKKETIDVSIKSWEEESFFHYSIEDKGAGFDSKYSNQLFNVFQRLHKDEDFKGTGVGLAIVNKIVSKHGGSISGTGELGKGARFEFTLPQSNKSTDK
ncbi:MAG: PAS domain S-box protein [Cyclobacteriaceae bacterium]